MIIACAGKKRERRKGKGKSESEEEVQSKSEARRPSSSQEPVFGYWFGCGVTSDDNADRWCYCDSHLSSLDEGDNFRCEPTCRP